MPQYLLRPDGDTKADWTENPGGTAAAVLDDAVTQPTAPATGSDMITTSASVQTSAQTVTTTTLAGGEAVSSATAWVYGKAVDGSNYYTIQLFTGGLTLASTNYTAASFGWGSATFQGTLTQTQIDGLEVRVVSIGTGALEVDASYIELNTRLGGGMLLKGVG